MLCKSETNITDIIDYINICLLFCPTMSVKLCCSVLPMQNDVRHKGHPSGHCADRVTFVARVFKRCLLVIFSNIIRTTGLKY